MAKLILPVLVLALAIACGGNDNDTPSPTSPASSPTTAVEEQVSATATQPPAQPSPTASPEPREGSHLLIPKILVDAPVSVKPISPAGSLPSPDSRHEVVLFDLSSFQLNAGDPSAGNAIMTGYLDAGSVPCHNDYVPPPCWAVFGSLSELSTGDEMMLLWQGEEILYSIVSFCWMANSDPIDSFVGETSHQALTLMTAAGYLDDGSQSYSHQLIIRAVSEPTSPGIECGPGSSAPLPTPTAEPGAPSHAVSIDSITSPVRPGGEVTLIASTEPLAECLLDLNRQTGIRVLGFEATANSSGAAEFRWRIPDHYPAGTYSVAIDCGAGAESIDLVLE